MDLGVEGRRNATSLETGVTRIGALRALTAVARLTLVEVDIVVAAEVTQAMIQEQQKRFSYARASARESTDEDAVAAEIKSIYTV